jgi:hypothetical protein
MQGLVATGNDGTVYFIHTLDNVDVVGYSFYVDNALNNLNVLGYSYEEIINKRVDFSKIDKEKFYVAYTEALDDIWKASEDYGFRYFKKKIQND